jgi:hypothetical protein
VTKTVSLVVGLVLVVIVGLAMFRAIAGGPQKARGPEAGVVTVGHSGFEDGHVAYTKDVPKNVASSVGTYLHQVGWFPNGGGDGSLTNHGVPKYSRTQGAGRGSVALVEMERTPGAYRIVLYSSNTDESVKKLSKRAPAELTAQLGVPVEWVVRVEKDLGHSIEWTDWSPAP